MAGLFDFANQHETKAEPLREREAVRAAAESFHDIQTRQGDIERGKAIITEMLQQDQAAQYILYSAVGLIGLCTEDQAWTDAAKESLQRHYGDLEQMTIVLENHAANMEELKQKQAAYIDKARRRLKFIDNKAKDLISLISTSKFILDQMEEQPEYINENGNAITDAKNKNQENQVNPRPNL